MKIYIPIFLALMAMTAFSAELYAAEAKFTGVKSCKICHKKKKVGAQFAVWEKSKHAGAYKTLGTDKALENAKKLGVEGNPQKSEACLVCHTTGFGADKSRFGKKFKIQNGVQCESCHGPGSKYKAKKTMKKIFKERGPDRKGVSATAKETGLTFPDEQTCKNCHVKEITKNGKTFKNPENKPFDFKERFEKIKHLIPNR